MTKKAKAILAKLAVSPEYVASKVYGAATTIARDLKEARSAFANSRATYPTKIRSVLFQANKRMKQFNETMERTQGPEFVKQVKSLVYKLDQQQPDRAIKLIPQGRELKIGGKLIFMPKVVGPIQNKIREL
jgi:hypothetical protein